MTETVSAQSSLIAQEREFYKRANAYAMANNIEFQKALLILSEQGEIPPATARLLKIVGVTLS